jgi:hypothetical protein
MYNYINIDDVFLLLNIIYILRKFQDMIICYFEIYVYICFHNALNT